MRLENRYLVFEFQVSVREKGKVQQAAPLQNAFLDLGVGSPLAATCRKTYSIFASRTMFSEMCVHTSPAGEGSSEADG